MPRVFFGRVFGNRGNTGPPPAPALPTLAIADLAAVPTGATATISGGSSSSVNTISYQIVGPNFQITPPGWTVAGSRTGNGTVALSLPAGIYWFRCDAVLNGQTEVSNLVYAGLTDGLAAVHERCIQAIEAGLVTLVAANKIPGITSVSRIYDQVEMNMTGMDLPGIAISVDLPGANPAETQVGGTNVRDDIGYPVYLTFVDRSSGMYVANRPAYLLARQRIFRYFRNQRLGTIPEVYIVKPEPGPVLKITRGDYNLTLSVLVLRPISREVRGTA
jgi:hypothetical protein